MCRPVSKTGPWGFDSLPACFFRGVAQRPSSSLTNWPTWVRLPPPLSPALDGAAVYETAGRWFNSIRGNSGDVAELGRLQCCRLRIVGSSPTVSIRRGSSVG